LIGDEAFFAFLRDYADTYAGQIVTSDDFFDLLAEHTDADIQPLLDEYFAEP
jgi:aminopeptidase N